MSSDLKTLLNTLRAEGITDERVLDAIVKTPREKFIDAGFEAGAYSNRALPISCGQTISQPYVVAYMTEKLEIAPHMRVLEIGTGSGYQAAILARLAAEVYTVERHLPLLEKARARFADCGFSNIFTRHGDGFEGWPEKAPFDRIIVTAAFRKLPESLNEQLTNGGIMITPLGYETISQRLWKMIRTEEGLEREELLPVVFVPMIKGLPQGEKSTDNEDEYS
jgi:protein-L-isoaspartate(D-aspartate) O-methyltransferase